MDLIQEFANRFELCYRMPVKFGDSTQTRNHLNPTGLHARRVLLLLFRVLKRWPENYWVTFFNSEQIPKNERFEVQYCNDPGDVPDFDIRPPNGKAPSMRMDFYREVRWCFRQYKKYRNGRNVDKYVLEKSNSGNFNSYVLQPMQSKNSPLKLTLLAYFVCVFVEKNELMHADLNEEAIAPLPTEFWNAYKDIQTGVNPIKMRDGNFSSITADLMLTEADLANSVAQNVDQFEPIDPVAMMESRKEKILSQMKQLQEQIESTKAKLKCMVTEYKKLSVSLNENKNQLDNQKRQQLLVEYVNKMLPKSLFDNLDELEEVLSDLPVRTQIQGVLLKARNKREGSRAGTSTTNVHRSPGKGEPKPVLHNPKELKQQKLAHESSGTLPKNKLEGNSAGTSTMNVQRNPSKGEPKPVLRDQTESKQGKLAHESSDSLHRQISTPKKQVSEGSTNILRSVDTISTGNMRKLNVSLSQASRLEGNDPPISSFDDEDSLSGFNNSDDPITLNTDMHDEESNLDEESDMNDDSDMHEDHDMIEDSESNDELDTYGKRESNTAKALVGHQNNGKKRCAETNIPSSEYFLKKIRGTDFLD